MSWKNISKSSYTIVSGKFTLPSSQPFILEPQGQKIYYSEGDEITSVANHVFNLDFTGVPHAPSHDPCGYWHKNYVPLVYDIYTSKLYPVYHEDLCFISCDIIDGSLNKVYTMYMYPPEEVIIGSIILNGSLNDIFITYNCNPDTTIIQSSILDGTLNDIFILYSMPPEDFIAVSSSIINGSLNEVLIVYSNWLPEQIIISSSINGGTHVSS